MDEVINSRLSFHSQFLFSHSIYKNSVNFAGKMRAMIKRYEVGYFTFNNIWFGLFVSGRSTFKGYLVLKLSLEKNSCSTIELGE